MTTHDAMTYGPFLRVGVVGCGRVGRTVCEAIDGGLVQADLAAVCDTNAHKVQTLVFQLKRPTRSMSLTGLVASVDIVVEATNRHAAPVVMMAALNGGRDLLVTNSAAIYARDDFARLAHERGLTILAANNLLASGCALNAASAVPGAKASLTLTCPFPVVAGAAFLRGRKLKVGGEPQLVFQGEAGDAMAGFPTLANLVAAAEISAAGMELLVRVRAAEGIGHTDIELALSANEQQTTTHSRVPADGAEPVRAEVIGTAAVGVLRWLVRSLRLT